MRADRFHTGVVTALAGLVLLTHVLGATALKSALWGSHFYAFLPTAALPLALVAAAIGVALVWRGRLAAPRAAPAKAVSVRARLAFAVALAALAFAILWWLRIRHTLLGDSGPLSTNLPLGERTHHVQPLSALLHHHVYEWTRGWFAAPGRGDAQVAFDTVAFDSVVAGAVFVPVAIALARRLVAPLAIAPLAAALILAQGFIQLFFGYVENYTWFTLMLGLYLWAGLAFLAGRAPLILAALPLIAALGFNLSGIILLPSLLVLAGWGMLDARRRAGIARDLVLALAALAGLQLLLGRVAGYDVSVGLRYMWDLAARGKAMEDRSLATLLSPAHLRDLFAVHLLIGPFAGLLLVPAALHRVVAGGRAGLRDPRLPFLLAAATPPLVASFTYGDSIQGLPRDWDLFAPFALLYVAAAIYCLASSPAKPATLTRLMAVAVLVSLFHTGAWVALNGSELRSLARYKTLPATRGRTEMVVGYWYLRHDQPALAREWFTRSVTAYPGNNAAQYELGLFAMDEGKHDEAVQRFWIATQSRPDKTNYRFALVDAMVLAGHFDATLPHLQMLIRAEPARAEYWACAGIVLWGMGRAAQARAAFDRALALAPSDSMYAELRARAEEPEAYASALRADWDAVVLK